MPTTIPTPKSTKAAWEAYADRIGIDTDGLTKAQIIDACTKTDAQSDDVVLASVADIDDATTAAEERAVEILLGNDDRPSPAQDLDIEVPEEFQFSTDTGRRRDPDKLLITLDGIKCYLYQPSRTLMIIMASKFSPGADPLEKVGAMLNLINGSLDTQGRMIINRMMTAGDGGFDDALPGKLAWTILNRWAPTLAQDVDMNVPQEPTPAPKNRTQRRQAAKKNRKK